MRPNQLLSTLFFVLFILSNPSAQAQEISYPNLYLDCDRNCFHDYLRSNLVNVNFMRNRQDADVYIKMYSARTAGGGTTYKMEVSGKDRFEDIVFIHEFTGDPDMQDKERKELLKTEIDKILVPFWLHSNSSPEMEISVQENNEEDQLSQQFDPWNYWVFNIGIRGRLNGQEQFRQYEGNANISASRVTDQAKFHTGIHMEYEESEYKVDEEVITSLRKNGSLWALYVHSMTEHWSAGAGGFVSTSTFGNYDLRTKWSAALEYNVFPYSLATERQFSFLYRIGPVYHDYKDTTLYLKTSELLGHHSMDVQYEIDEDWGSARMRVSWGNYLHDWSLFNLTFAPFFEWNIVKGLNLHGGAHFSWIRDQINIPKSSATSEEVLLQLIQLQTNYSYGFFGGVNYRFGSDMNNVVNRRFDEFF